ncbi:DinB family protein [Glycomyces paridis]|uniref:DinB family protein n=1 Tax=Glycomyces paridis TaxID=2126555 RepID=A0A4S8P964_9ACTN|nr:DinB family protein [Glycomyces paridis]THV26211.1 DinB family protein [Glycomyces paridis]
MTDLKSDLHRYLKSGRDALVWKLEGLGEYDLRRPLTPTGTNLLGLVKHVTCVSADYFGAVFDRPFPDPQPWFDPEAEPNADMYALAEESTESLLDLHRRVWEHADATIEALDLDAPGTVPWWGDVPVTLGEILVHMIAELNRHAGHADIVRETIDGTAGLRKGGENLPEGDEDWWVAYRDKVEQAACTAAGI